MKKKRILLFGVLSVLLFVSCTIEFDSEEGPCSLSGKNFKTK